MRGKPKPRKGSDLAAWRSRQKPGAIMKPSTFAEIAQEAAEKLEKKGISPAQAKIRGKKQAGEAYWEAAEAKSGKKRKK